MKKSFWVKQIDLILIPFLKYLQFEIEVPDFSHVLLEINYCRQFHKQNDQIAEYLGMID